MVDILLKKNTYFTRARLIKKKLPWHKDATMLLCDNGGNLDSSISSVSQLLSFCNYDIVLYSKKKKTMI